MRPFSMFVLLGILSLSPLLRAQQPADTPNGQPAAGDAANGQSNVETDLAAEVQQLRVEVDRLRRELTRVQTELDNLRSERAAPQITDSEPAQPAPETPEKKQAAPRAGGTASRATTARTPARAPAPAAPDSEEKSLPVTVFVFRDGHRTEARNYAIIGPNIWVYTADDSKKIPIADLDLAATRDANSERGVTFQLPPTP